MFEQLMTYRFLIPIAIMLAIIPFGDPHLVGKIRMLMEGTLKKPIDIFDLFWHSWPIALLGYKLVKDFILT